MKILFIHASPRKTGTTSTILAAIEAEVATRHEIESVHVSRLRIKPCTGCMKCRPDLSCILPQDDAHLLAARFQWADFIVIGCPVYWGNMPGSLKLFFDRNVPLFEYAENRAIRYIPKPRLRGKKAAIVVSSIGPFPFNLLPSQSGGTLRALRTIFKAAGMKVEWVINIADSCNFERKKERYLRQARRRALSMG
jgi:putative NADPH-quinone reductase